MTNIKTLMTGVAAIALATATPVLAQTADVATDSQVTITDDTANADANATVDLDNDGTSLTDEVADAAKSTGEAISDTASDVAQNVEETVDGMTPATMTAGALVGYEVAAGDGEVIGEVDNVVLVNGQEMAVVGIGGFLGLGEHDVALPLSDLTASAADEKTLEADGYTKAQLEAMAEFDPNAAEEISADEPVMLGAS